MVPSDKELDEINAELMRDIKIFSWGIISGMAVMWIGVLVWLLG